MTARSAVVFATVVLIVDQVTKWMVLSWMKLGQTIEVIPGVFSLTSIRNRGAAFGILANLPGIWHTVFFVLVAGVAVFGLGWLFRATPEEGRLQRAGLAGIISGAIGNLIDRVRFGEVVDFLDCYWGAYHWPAFNVADSFITLGAAALILTSLRPEPTQPD